MVTHAAFKALLFLGAGSVNHATGTFDMRYMGGLRKVMPVTYVLMFIAGLSLVGIIPLPVFGVKTRYYLVPGTEQDWWIPGFKPGVTFFSLIVGVVAPAFYTMRMIILTFHGEFRGGIDKEIEDRFSRAADDTNHSAHGGSTYMNHLL
ncbi:MAG: hypothetical protein Ct9H300mP11_23050 [Chloroflexota bacterium]|nr:MAG: hypothetical protein Ct9H300mP11_23050 [Chloroflexota bacterium]